MKGIARSLFAFLFFVLLFLSSQKAKASDAQLVINEVYPAPLSDEKEWVEIYNPAALDVDLSDYSLKDGSIAAKNLSGTILAENYFVFEVSSGWLNNSGETLSLVYKPSAIAVDKVTYGDWDDGDTTNNAQKPASGGSISRIPNGGDTGIDIDDFQIVPTTKGGENILPPPVVYSDKIIINEILPQPATVSGDEFIELYNSGDTDVDLSNWRLDDASAGSEYEIPAGTIIGAKRYLVFCKDSTRPYCDFTNTKIALNDTSSDHAILLDPNGDLKYQVPDYTKARRGQSFSKFDNNWQWTITLTPGSYNIFSEEIDLAVNDIQIIDTDIVTARTLLDETVVAVIGTVSVVPGKLSSQYFYIQDLVSGIQIYNYNKEFPVLSPGDEIKVCGELATSSNERRIKITAASDITILNTHPPPEAQKKTINSLGESLEGRYIVVTGTVTKTSGNTFYIHGSGEIQVAIREGTDINKPKMHVGDLVQIAGILSQYKDSYRILPTRQDDVKIVKSASLAKSGADLSLPLVISVVIILLWNIFQKVKKKQRISPQRL